MNLANLESLTVEVNLVEPKGVATGVVGATKIFVPLAGIVDIAGRKARLEKELAKVEKDLEQSPQRNLPTVISVPRPRPKLFKRKKIN